ncbi:MAG: NADH-quinone oxidoreductase subunit M, partial [Aquificaceae bacterium]
LFLNFNWQAQGFQYITRLEWIPSLGIPTMWWQWYGYIPAADDRSCLRVRLSGTWKVEDRPNLYFALFLLLETACLGVFLRP